MTSSTPDKSSPRFQAIKAPNRRVVLALIISSSSNFFPLQKASPRHPQAPQSPRRSPPLSPPFFFDSGATSVSMPGQRQEVAVAWNSSGCSPPSQKTSPSLRVDNIELSSSRRTPSTSPFSPGTTGASPTSTTEPQRRRVYILRRPPASAIVRSATCEFVRSERSSSTKRS